MSKKFMAALLAVVMLTLPVLTACGKDQDTWQESDASAQSYGCAVYREQGCAKMVWASGAELQMESGSTLDVQAGVDVDFDDATFNGTTTYTLGAADKALLDGATTANTGTAGILDINHATITANASAVNIAETVNTGATAAADNFGMVMTLTQDDADADLFGISMTAAATTNAAAGSYEAGFVYDCAENTAGACLDGVRLTAGTATGMTDGLDASDADIVNAVNIGVNPILGDNADTLFLGLTDHHLTLTGNEAAAVTFIGADDAGAANTVFDTTGAGTATVGSADVASVNARGIAMDFDMTGGVSIDADLASNFSTAAGDITVEAETGSVTLKGDEGAADAVHLDADQTAGGGVTIAANTGGVDVNLTAAGPFAIDGDMLIVGNDGADGDVADADNDMLVVGVLEVDGEIEADGAIDADAGVSVAGGSLNVDDAVDVDGSSDEIQLAVTGYTTQTTDLAFFDGGLVDIGGGTYATADGDNDLGVEGDLEVNGAVDHDGTTFDSDVSSAISLDAGASSNFSTSAGDITIAAEAGSVTVIGSEADANAIHLDANDTVTSGINIDVGSVSGLQIDGGLTDFGGGTYTVADGDNDVGIAGDLEVEGVTYMDGGAEINGTLTLENDETIVNSTNGVVQIGGFFALTEGTVQVVSYGSTLTCVASFQPITSTAVITNVIIADGALAGQIVVISNENAADDITILEAGSNLQAGGDVVLGGGDKDLLTLLWDGAEWIRLSFFDN